MMTSLEPLPKSSVTSKEPWALSASPITTSWRLLSWHIGMIMLVFPLSPGGPGLITKPHQHLQYVSKLSLPFSGTKTCHGSSANPPADRCWLTHWRKRGGKNLYAALTSLWEIPSYSRLAWSQLQLASAERRMANNERCSKTIGKKPLSLLIVVWRGHIKGISFFSSPSRTLALIIMTRDKHLQISSLVLPPSPEPL